METTIAPTGVKVGMRVLFPCDNHRAHLLESHECPGDSIVGAVTEVHSVGVAADGSCPDYPDGTTFVTATVAFHRPRVPHPYGCPWPPVEDTVNLTVWPGDTLTVTGIDDASVNGWWLC